MNKSKLLNLLVVVLIITNLIALSLFFLGRKKHKKNAVKTRNPKEIIISELKFDDTQKQQFELLIEEHRSSLDKQRTELHKTKQALFNSLADTTLNSDSLIKEVNKTQLIIEKTHFNHFLSIKKICKQEQLGAFEKLSKKLGHIFTPPRKPGTKPKRH